MVIVKGFFFVAKSISDEYYFFCHRWKQNHRIRHSDRAFNAHQIEIFVATVSIAKTATLLNDIVFIHWKFIANCQWHWQSFQ